MFSTMALAHPISRPVALKLTGFDTLDSDIVDDEMPRNEMLGGIDSNTAEGIVNVPADAGAWQVKAPTTKSVWLPLMDPNDVPVMETVLLGSPPVQVTV